jgi:hypothetical protein
MSVFACSLIIVSSAPELEVSLFEFFGILHATVSSFTMRSLVQDHWIESISTAALDSVNGSAIGSTRLTNQEVVSPGFFHHLKSHNLIVIIY